MDEETRALLALKLVPGLGPRLTQALLDQFGSATQALSASAGELRSIRYISEKAAQDMVQAMRNLDVSKELELLVKHHTRLVRLGSPDYPQRLDKIFDPPQLLYMKGAWLEQDANAVGIVGSRQCTSYGRRVAERLAGELARAGFTVVSGLARGIDGMAHRGALAAKGRTIAVMACGLSRIYPPEHRELADEVAAAGALISEAPMAMSPMAEMFPARNRLISGLGRGVIIVEANEKSGALITAKHALEQGREVFAVPGPIDNPASRGAHHLIRNGATLVRGIDDILEGLGETRVASDGKRVQTRAKPVPQLTESQQAIWSLIEEEPQHIDDLAERTKLPVVELGSTLMAMEMQGLIRRLPGNRYERS